MAKVEIKLNRRGVKDLLKSQEMMNVCTKQAFRAKSKLGDGYVVSYRTGKTHVNASIAAEKTKAIRENAMKNTILKALRG